jgi:hypothetical protein
MFRSSALKIPYFFLVVSIWFLAESPVPPPVVSWLVVSLVEKPGVLAPAAPVPVESPDIVDGFPLQEASANITAISTPISSLCMGFVSFSIAVVFIKIQIQAAYCFYSFTKSLIR